MNNSTLDHFRALADIMAGPDTDWQWIGVHISQRLFGISEIRAKDYAARFGGVASKMEVRS